MTQFDQMKIHMLSIK